jgi:dihydroorotase
MNKQIKPLLITDGHLVDSRQGIDEPRDLYIEDGVVKGIEKPGILADQIKQADIIDAKGKYLFPGLIDVHVHLREPGQEWKETLETGARAALAGGFTSVCCMPNTDPAIDNAETVAWIRRKSESLNLAHIYPIGAVTHGRAGKTLAPLRELVEEGCVAFSDDGAPVYDTGIMRRALETARDLDRPITCHEEVLSLTKGGCVHESPLSVKLGLGGMPGAAEDIMVARDIELARLTGGHVHICHISTARSVELVRRAKNESIAVTAEVTAHHLFFNEEKIASFDTNYKMSPPLRGERDRAACLAGLLDGTIDIVASDHAPHDSDSKRVTFPESSFGILGLQTTAPLLFELIHKKMLSRERFVAILSDLPARLFRLPGGHITPGASATITIFDPESSWTLDETTNYSKSRNSPWWGSPLQGRAWCVVVDGTIKVADYTIKI